MRSITLPAKTPKTPKSPKAPKEPKTPKTPKEPKPVKLVYHLASGPREYEEIPEDTDKNFIKIRISPQGEGFGEGIWARLAASDRAEYERNTHGGVIIVRLANDPLNIPGLCGDYIPVTLMGNLRPEFSWKDYEAHKRQQSCPV